ncbi:MAG: hypothetical protein C0504_13930 [Candidatus Solibacter sp.]|nr:hypothetical protein [Candidatus Solibacter sp.]
MLFGAGGPRNGSNRRNSAPRQPVTGNIRLAVIAKTFPLTAIRAALADTRTASVRQPDLPAHVVVCYVIALAIHMQTSYCGVPRRLLEGIHWLRDTSAHVKAAGRPGISRARARLGWEPLRQLHDELVKPVAVETTQGAGYRQWRLVSLDGSALDVAGGKADEEPFGRPGASRGGGAYPRIRVVALVESGTHVLSCGELDACGTGGITLAKRVLPRLRPGTLCPADRYFFGFKLWEQARAAGAELLWRVKWNMRL